MEAVFLKLLNMSLTGCVLIVAVLPVRALLKKAPGWSRCLLWLLVALRLICPVTLESDFSLIRNSEPISQEVLSAEPFAAPVFTEPVQYEASEQLPPVQSTPVQSVVQMPKRETVSILTLAGYVWLVGAVVMLLYAVASCWLLKRRVATATRLEGNLRQSEYVQSPFVLGVFRPVIYLPYGLKQTHLDHIVAHERSHICRGDHLIKPLGFTILSIHWFNPCVWLAYLLLCRDIEAACDERVIKNMTRQQRQSYSATLLHYSVKHHRITACPVAFGETGIRGRIKTVMNYKKPAVWLVILSMLLCILLAGCFLTDPVQEQPRQQQSLSIEDQEKIDALVEQIAKKARQYGHNRLRPDSYRIIDAEAREQVMSFGEPGLEYLISGLRKSDNDQHNAKEQIVVFLCADMSHTAPMEERYDSTWWEIPGKWLAIYDQQQADLKDRSRLQPGYYKIASVLYGDSVDVYEACIVRQKEFTVTQQGFYIRNIEKQYVEITHLSDDLTTDSYGSVRVKNREYDYTMAFSVNWKWEKPDQTDDFRLLLSQPVEEWKVYPGFQELLLERDYSYQQIDADRFLIQTRTGLYTKVYLIGQHERQLQYVYELEKSSVT